MAEEKKKDNKGNVERTAGSSKDAGMLKAGEGSSKKMDAGMLKTGEGSSKKMDAGMLKAGEGSSEEMKDIAAIKYYAEKSSDYSELAKKLTEYFTKKYGAYFGGKVTFEYNMAEDRMKMTCNRQSREFEIDDLQEITSQIQFLKKTDIHK